MLAENRRLNVLAEIAAQFEVLKNEREGTVEAEIVSAFPMDQSQVQELLTRLEAKHRQAGETAHLDRRGADRRACGW